ncbi:hypothetical protein F2Q70_00030767 [Brassica cretica]|uniref:Uncharacterized protein n=1 Tax=Brassica cretica TaxID=69181 RepID=A0A8S9FBP6_BRACR|nr:hypothetical protein F2Q70_00030767 [Brassica cretica]
MVRRPYKLSACEAPRWLGHVLPLVARNRGRASFHAPALSVRGPLSPVDDGFQHFHETCSHIHPLERPGSEVSCLAKCLHPVSATRPLLQIRLMYPLRRSPWSTRAPLVYPRDHWLISDKVLGDFVYVRRGTKVLRGPGLASRCNFEGLRRRPCGAVDIYSGDPLGSWNDSGSAFSGTTPNYLYH